MTTPSRSSAAPRPCRSRHPRSAAALGRVAFVLLAVATFGGPAEAQSQGDLRRENEQLRQEVVDLRAELERLRTQLEDAEREALALRTRVAELEAAATARSSGTPGPPGTPGTPGDSGSTDAPGSDAATTDPSDEDRPVITVDESRPNASPRSVRAEARARWEVGPGSLELGVDAASPQRINYLRVLESWVREQERTWRLPVSWVVEPLGPGREDRTGTTWRMQARDPVSDAVLGAPFEVHARRGIVRGLERDLARAADDQGLRPDRLALTGDTVVRFTVDPRRPTPGTFDNPPLLAPFLTFQFGVEATKLDLRRPARAPAVDPSPPAGAAGAAGASDG